MNVDAPRAQPTAPRFSIFYSWQSDLPNKCNRTLIQEALDRAAASVGADPSIGVDPAIDRDTAGVPGSPDISASIFAKIEEASLFIADVSLISDVSASRPTCNPNVLLELGYAARSLGWERVLMVFNEHWGRVADLPFDLRNRRVIAYSMNPEEAPAASRADLTHKLTVGIRSVYDRVRTNRTVAPPPLAAVSFASVNAVLADLPRRSASVGKPPDMLVKTVVLGPADNDTIHIPLRALGALAQENTIALRGWPAAHFPYGPFPGAEPHYLPDRLEYVDRNTWPTATRSFHHWGIDTRACLFEVEDVREDNRARQNLSGVLAVEWALVDIVRPLLFAARLMVAVHSEVPFQVSYHWQLGSGRRLEILDKRRDGLVGSYVSRRDVWRHDAVLYKPGDVFEGAMAAADTLAWQFGWDHDVEPYLTEQVSALVDGRYPS